MEAIVLTIPFPGSTCQNVGFPGPTIEAHRVAPIPLSAATVILLESIRFVISREVACRLVSMRILRTLVGVLVFALACGFPAIERGLISTARAEEEETAQPAEEDDSQVSAEENEKQASKEQDDNKKNKSKEKEDDTPAEDAEADKAEPRNDTDQDQPVEQPAEKTEEKPAPKKKTNEKPADEKPAEEKPANEKSEKSTDEKPAPEKETVKSTDKKKQDPKKKKEKTEAATEEEVSEAQKAANEEEDAKAAEDEAAGKASVEIDESDEVEEEPEEADKSPNKPVVAEETPPKSVPSAQKRVIGATATLMEKQSELLFRARVDSGAKSCSLHIEDYKIENESDTMAENIGKVIRFNIMNGDGESHWLEAKIASYVIVKTAAHRERRYKVPLTFRYKDFEKTVLVTLNNRDKMEFPLLLGRNFLLGDFVVDVELDNNELHTK